MLGFFYGRKKLINDLKNYLQPLLKAEGFVSIESSYDAQPEDYQQTDKLPALLITRGEGAGSQSSGDSRVFQRIDRNIIMDLKCHELQLEGLTEILFRHLLGWQYNPNWSGINCFGDEPMGATGPYVWIRFRFGTWVTAKEGQYYNGSTGPGRNLPKVDI